uniref:Uncharacterized protein n=1 Tax=Triticum urartu TaxID=4572 RepID=A0A8R7QJU5_TRIUA
MGKATGPNPSLFAACRSVPARLPEKITQSTEGPSTGTRRAPSRRRPFPRRLPSPPPPLAMPPRRDHGKQAQHRAAPTPAPSSMAAGGIEEKMDPADPNADATGVAAGLGGAGDELSALLKKFSAAPSARRGSGPPSTPSSRTRNPTR